MKTSGQRKREILDLVRKYHAAGHARQPFVPGSSRVPYAGRVFDSREMVNLVDSALEFWLTAGGYAKRFEGGLA